MSAGLAWMRRIAAVLILLSLVLPMSRCTTRVNEQFDAQGNVVATTPVYEDVVPFDLLDDSAAGVAWMLAFAWPLLSQFLVAWRRRLGERRAYLGLELLLLVPTAWVGSAAASLGQDLRYGAFVLALAIAAYALATASLLWSLIRRQRGLSPAPR